MRREWHQLINLFCLHINYIFLIIFSMTQLMFTYMLNKSNQFHLYWYFHLCFHLYHQINILLGFMVLYAHFHFHWHSLYLLIYHLFIFCQKFSFIFYLSHDLLSYLLLKIKLLNDWLEIWNQSKLNVMCKSLKKNVNHQMLLVCIHEYHRIHSLT